MRERVARETERRLSGEVLAAALSGRLAADDLRDRLAPFGIGEQRRGARLRAATTRTRPQADPRAALRRRRAAPRWSAPTRPGRRELLCAVVDAGDGRPGRARRPRRARAPARRRTARPAPPPAGPPPAERVRHCFHEARCALEATGFSNGAAPEVASHRDLGAFTLLLSVQDDDALRLYCESVLGPIENSDERYAGELLRSLEAFIDRNGHWERAAERLLLPPPHPALPDQADRGADRPRPEPGQRPGRAVAGAAGEGADRAR